MPKVLPEIEIQNRLKEIPKWKRNRSEISSNFKFKDFLEAMEFVNKTAALSEKIDHHPDILIQWNRVSLTLTTHSARGLTDLDFVLAKRIDGVK